MLTSLIWSVERSTDLTGLKVARLSSVCMAEAAEAVDCACLLACKRELRRLREFRSRSPRLGVNGSLVHECVDGDGVMVGAGDESTTLQECVGEVQQHADCGGAMCDARSPLTMTSSASDSISGSNGMGGGDEHGVATAELSCPDADPLAKADDAAEQLDADKHDDDMAPDSSMELFRCDECEWERERSNDGRPCSLHPAGTDGMPVLSSPWFGGGDGSTDRLLLVAAL